MSVAARDVIEALVAISDDKIWATEVHFYDREVDSRVDFWTLEPTRSQRFRSSAYEIKISRADFNRDSEQKQDAALKFSDRFWYVAPPGVIDEIPAWAGLMTWDGERFSVVKKAPKREKAAPSWEVIVSILRSSDQHQRDVGLLKGQIAFLRAEVERNRRAAKMRDRFRAERFKRQFGGAL